MTGIPTPAALSILHDLKHSPLEQAYIKVMEDHTHAVRLGAIGLLLRLFVYAALIANMDEVYLFDHYQFA